MGTKRVVNGNKDIQKILKGKNGESVFLPIFSKDDDGIWVFEGLDNINTLEEYNAYKKQYNEFLEFVYENFNSSIAKLYKKTLNNLIYVGDRNDREINVCSKNRNQNLVDSLVAKKGKSISQGMLLATKRNESSKAKFSYYRNSDVQNMQSIVNLVRFAKGGRKRYVPSKLNEFLKNEGIMKSGKTYMLPELSDKGIVAKIGRESGNIEMNFVQASEDEAEAWKNYMLEISKDDKNLTEMIKNYFDECSGLADMGERTYGDYATLLSDVIAKSTWLFDLDPTGFLPRKRACDEALAGEQGEIFAEEDAGLIGEDSGLEPKNGSAEGFENANLESGVNVSMIQMNSPYSSSPGLDGADIVINIKPTNGAQFRVVLEGEKLKVSKTAENASEAQTELDK